MTLNCFPNVKKNWKPNTSNDNAQSGHRDGIRNKKIAILITRRGKGNMTEEIELSNQEKIRMLGEKETYK